LKIIKNTLVTFSTQITVVILGIGARILIAAVLGPEGQGAYSLIILVPVLLATMGNLGIGIANVYFGGGKKAKWGELVSNSLSGSFMLGISLAVIFLFYFTIFHPSFLKGVEPRAVFLAILVLPFSLLTTYFTGVLLGQNRIKEYNLIHLIHSGASLLLLLLLLFVLKGDVFKAIIARVCAALIGTAFSIAFVRKTTDIKWAFHSLLFKDSVKFGFQGQLGNIIQFMNYRLDMFMIAFFMSTTDVGYYSISVVLAEALWYLPASAGTVIFARTPGVNAEEANKSTPVVCRNIFFITIMASLALFVFGRHIIHLFFGPAFLPSVQPFNILLPGIAASSICKVLCNEIAGRGKPLMNTVAAGISLAVNVPLNMFFIPKMGIAGAALASTISYTLSALVVLAAFMRISGNSLFDMIVIKPRDLRIYTGALAKMRRRPPRFSRLH